MIIQSAQYSIATKPLPNRNQTAETCINTGMQAILTTFLAL